MDPCFSFINIQKMDLISILPMIPLKWLLLWMG